MVNADCRKNYVTNYAVILCKHRNAYHVTGGRKNIRNCKKNDDDRGIVCYTVIQWGKMSIWKEMFSCHCVQFEKELFT